MFDEISKKVGDRQGGYTRIVKLGNRMGDNASMAMIELVDYNNIYNSNPIVETSVDSQVETESK